MIDGYQRAEDTSSDDFGRLAGNLPQPELTQNQIRTKSSFSTDFVQWQLSRYNRAGNIKFTDCLSSSFRVYRKHFKTLLPLSLFTLVIEFFLFRFKYSIWLAMFTVIASLAMSAISLSYLSNEKVAIRFRRFVSIKGFICLSFKLLYTILAYLGYIRFIGNQSHWLLLLILAFLLYATTFFFPCFVFEAADISPILSIKFNFTLLTKSNIILPYIQTFLIYIVLFMLGVFTLGISTWMAFIVQGTGFITICGSSTSKSPNVGLV